MFEANVIRAAVIAGIMAASLLPTTASAGALPTKKFVYDARQVALTDVLRDFAGAAGLPIVIADGVSGTVNAKFSVAPQGFLELVSRGFGLIWYFDGTVLYVYPSNQIQSRMFKLSGPLAVDAEARFKSFGLLDSRYPVKFIPGGSNTVIVASGPPRHIELIDSLIEVMRPSEGDLQRETVKVFSLKYASAVDRTIQGITVPGVATTLTNFFGERHDPNQATAAALAGMAAPVAMANYLTGDPSANRARLDTEMRNAADAISGKGAAQPATPMRPASPGMVVTPPVLPKRLPGRATFTADESANLVLVRAEAEQMAEIENLIAKLDVSSAMIQVEATIIDISSEELGSLGFDWRFDGNASTKQLQFSGAGAVSSTTGAIPQGGGYNISTLLANGGKQLLAQIRALEARGSARVVSQPKVIGAANRSAVLSDKRTASVRVAGNQDARLYSVDTGTTLQVTPRLLPGDQVPRISLDLLIEDGGFSSEAVDGVPIAQRTSISTIATLNEGQALLVGGIEMEGNSSGRSGIPLLSKIPVVGSLFRFDSSQSSRRQRLFLITPRRVNLDQIATSSVPNP